MSNITVTYRDGRVAQLEQVYIRGSKIRFLILPDMLKNAPMCMFTVNEIVRPIDKQAQLS